MSEDFKSAKFQQKVGATSAIVLEILTTQNDNWQFLLSKSHLSIVYICCQIGTNKNEID